MLKVHQLELFYYVTIHRGITQASREMPYGVTQPGISRQMQDLRDTFLVIGSGALQTSKVAYGHIQVVADAGGDINRVVKHLKLRVNKPKRGATPTGTPAGSTNTAGPPAQPGAPTAKPSVAGPSDDGRGPAEKAA
jgi:hypothetical protein